MADGRQVSVIVPNLFLRVPVDAAVRAAGHLPLPAADAAAASRAPALVVIADLDALGPDVPASVRELVAAGKTVLAFGPHVEGELLATARAAGAVVLPRSVFLARLPELLRAALPPGRGDP